MLEVRWPLTLDATQELKSARDAAQGTLGHNWRFGKPGKIFWETATAPLMIDGLNLKYLIGDDTQAEEAYIEAGYSRDGMIIRAGRNPYPGNSLDLRYILTPPPNAPEI